MECEKLLRTAPYWTKLGIKSKNAFMKTPSYIFLGGGRGSEKTKSALSLMHRYWLHFILYFVSSLFHIMRIAATILLNMRNMLLQLIFFNGEVIKDVLMYNERVVWVLPAPLDPPKRDDSTSDTKFIITKVALI